MPIPTIANTNACIQKLALGTADKVIAMISAERMKSVLTALSTFSSSNVWAFIATVPTPASWSRTLWGAMGLQNLFGSFVAEIDTAQHEKRCEHSGKKIAD